MKQEKINNSDSFTEISSTDRRDFIRKGALLGGSTILMSQMTWATDIIRRAEAGLLTDEEKDELTKAENMIQTVCLQCNTGCAVKAKILNGIVVKIDGNPISPYTMNPPLPYKSKLSDITFVDGHICPKGQSGIQSAYDAYRIRQVLKRSGKRGQNKWISVPFDQAINEIVEGGKLFSNVPGEENRNVEGLRSVMAFTAKDKDVLKAMAKDVSDMKSKKGDEKKNAVEDFKKKYKDHLHKMIDPEHPDFGPKNNQMSFIWGRLKGGRGEFIRRFTSEAFGSVNAHGHTTVCQGSLYFAGKAMSEQFMYDEKSNKVGFAGGDKFYWQADANNSEFLIEVGSGIVEGGYISCRASHFTDNITSGKLKLVVVDPRYSKIASKAWKWIPAKPGTEGAMALALCRWVIENDKHNKKYLANANKAAATADKETTWGNATWLVKMEGEPGHEKPTAFLRASEAGLGDPEIRTYKKKANKIVTNDYGMPVLDDKGNPKVEVEESTVYDKNGIEVTYEFDPFVVLNNGKMVKVDPDSSKVAVEGDLTGEIKVRIKGKDGKKTDVICKPSFEFVKAEAFNKTMAEWSAICDIPLDILNELGKEFTSHGTKAVFDMHRGVSQHTNGYYNVIAGFTLNMLIGNYDHKGGLIKGNTYGYIGDKDGQPYKLATNSAKLDIFGIDIIKGGSKFEESTLWDEAKGKANYPSKRPWYPLATDVYQEIFPAISEQYPYSTKIIFTYMSAATYALPGGHKVIETLVDLDKLPLHIASDIIIGENSMYADYIFPDTSYLERWEFQGTQPVTPEKVQPIRQPVIAPIPESVKVFGQLQPISLESLILAIGEKLSLKSYGKDAFGPGLDLYHQDDFYLRAVANLAMGEKFDTTDAVPDASDEEVAIFMKARRHLPKEVFDAERWKKIVGEKYWKKVIYTLNRGGRVLDTVKAYDGDFITGKYGKQINFYQEKTAKTKNAITGKSNYGYAKYLPIQTSEGKPLEDEKSGYDLLLITTRDVTMTKSRTISNYYLTQINKGNQLLMNTVDAKAKGVANGDKVKISSASNPAGEWDLKNGTKIPMIGEVLVTEGIRPGVVSFTLGFGHWANGSDDFTLNGTLVKGDKRRKIGVHANAAFRLDPYLKNTSLCDLVGGSVVFYDTKIKVEKV